MKTLRELRLAKGFSQHGVAVELNVSVETLSKWKNMRVRPNELNQRKLAAYYGVDVSELGLAPFRQSSGRPVRGLVDVQG